MVAMLLLFVGDDDDDAVQVSAAALRDHLPVGLGLQLDGCNWMNWAQDLLRRKFRPQLRRNQECLDRDTSLGPPGSG
jgi:hypothetical protein